MNPSPDVLIVATQALTLTMTIGFLAYVGFVVVPFVRHRPAAAGDPREFGWHVLIPCRDEEAVIADTMAYVRRTFPLVHVWVVDDASNDDTAGVVADRAVRDGGVHLVRRCLPEARTGKADALNAGYREVVGWLAAHDALDEAERTIICVVDADGKLTPEALRVCAGPSLFGDPAIGAVQVDVRMSNRDDRVVDPRRGRLANFVGRTLVRIQDLESRTAIAAIQLSRRSTGTVSMGGTGQFTRVSALAGVDDDGSGRPWRGSLLADVELGVHLLAAGYRTAFTMDAHVDREGLPSLRRLLTRRTRWSQGTLQLIGTLVYPLPWILLGYRMLTEPDAVRAYLADVPGWLLFGIYGTTGVLPFLIWGPVYRRRCEPAAGPLRALGWGLAYAVYSYTFYVTCWWAALRIVRRRSGWARTRRNAEAPRGRVLATER